MKWFQRMRINFVFICIVVGVLTPVSYANPPSDRCILIKAQVANKDDVEALVNMDLDIWEFQQDGVIVRVTDNERKQVQESGFIIEIITEDVYEYLETIRKEQISLFEETTLAKYHSHGEVIAALLALEDSGVAQTYIIGNTHEGRDIWAVKISDNPSEDEEEPGALFLGCHHAREWISVEVPLYIAQYLADNYDIDEDVKHLVDNCEIWIVPVVNPDGYEYSRTNNRMWRKNRRNNGDGTFGVDLNRNYGYMWGGPGSSGNPSALNYRGPSAFSEPESQAVRDLVLAYDFRVLTSYHSFGQITFMPWGYTWEPCPDDLPMSSMSFRMREMIKQTSGSIYIDWFDWPGRYLTSGDTGDWSYGALGIYSFGIELPPITFSQGGFVLPENKIIPSCVENLPAALYLISLSADNGGIENLATGKTYGSIQFAINDANDGDEIVVDPGLYHENILSKGKNLTLRSTDPNDPAVVAATVINGGNQGSVVTFSGGEDASCVLSGFTITGGNADLGGGISCGGGSSPKITNCIITNNSAIIDGGGMYNELGSNPTLTDCTFSGNSAMHYGGGMFNGESSPTVTNCTFSGNSADYGGGMYNDSSSPTVTNCTFSGNSADYGGGMYNDSSSPMVTNCTFSGNSAGKGGGMYDKSGSPTLTNCTFGGNSAGTQGGGLYNYSSSPTVTNCTFSGNRAEEWGGGMANVASSPTVTNCTFSGNLAGTQGGGLYNYSSSPTVTNCTFSGNRAEEWGGGMANFASSPTVTNCTFSGNLAVYGGGMFNYYRSNSKLTNCILWRDTPDEIYVFGGALVVTYSDVQGGWSGESNIDANPFFVSPGYWGDVNDPNISVEPDDPNAVWVEGDYHLLLDSPCINAGDPNYIAEPNETDIDGQPRVWDGRVDMGADEFVPMLEVPMKFTPQALNPGSKGNWVKAHFVLPEGFDVDDVDANTPLILQPGDVESEVPMNVFVNEANFVEVEAAFERGSFCEAGISDEAMEVRVVGLFTSGQYFYGTDTIRIIADNLKYLGVLASHWLEGGCGAPDWCGGVDLDHSSAVDFLDFALFDGCCIEVIRQ